jgi:uncharacterized membrane protein YkvA (DUF1232 family)
MKKVNYIPYWKSLLSFIADKNTNWKPKVGVVLAVLYLIWPIDLIPDLIPIFGWLDDIGITALAALYLTYAVNSYISSINKQDQPKIDQTTNHELGAGD